jgi:pyruvate/2-oxoglutarate dehydrogenase complex dihydrolipoamide dehydrogenase (E3) component
VIAEAIAPHDSVERYTGLGVDVVEGHATIVDPWHVKIVRAADGRRAGPEHARHRHRHRRRPFVPPLPGLQEAGFLTSDTLWGLRELPPRLLVLGGGPIGCELAQSFARLGSQVTQVEMAPRLMMREDEEVSAYARQALEADGVRCSPATRRCAAKPTPRQVARGGSRRAPNSACPSTNCCCAPSAAARG